MVLAVISGGAAVAGSAGKVAAQNAATRVKLFISGPPVLCIQDAVGGTVKVSRSVFLASLIGQPWAWQGSNCWDFACHVQRELFGQPLPCIAVPDDPKWKWMVTEIGRHPERENWAPVAEGPHGLVQAADGALCLMGRFSGPGHVGVWLSDLRKVIHCDRQRGVCLEDDLALKQQGWIKRTYYQPK